MGIAKQFIETLDNSLSINTKSGVHVSQIGAVFQFHAVQLDLETTLSQGMYLPLIEMYFLCHGWNVSIKKRRAGTLLSGVDFKNNDVRDLVSVLTTGRMDQVESAATAKALYAKVFRNTNSGTETVPDLKLTDAEKAEEEFKADLRQKIGEDKQ